MFLDRLVVLFHSQNPNKGINHLRRDNNCKKHPFTYHFLGKKRLKHT